MPPCSRGRPLVPISGVRSLSILRGVSSSFIRASRLKSFLPRTRRLLVLREVLVAYLLAFDLRVGRCSRGVIASYGTHLIYLEEYLIDSYKT